MSFIAPNCLLPEIATNSMLFQTLRLCHGLAVHRHAGFGTDRLFDGLPVDFAAAVVLIFLLTWAAQPNSFVKTASEVLLQRFHPNPIAQAQDRSDQWFRLGISILCNAMEIAKSSGAQ